MFYRPGSDTGAPRVVVAAVPDRGPMWYLIDQDLDFIPEVKDFLDWKTATRRAPATSRPTANARPRWRSTWCSRGSTGLCLQLGIGTAVDGPLRVEQRSGG